MAELTDLSKMSNGEMNEYLLTLRKKQFNLRFQKANNELKETHLISKVKREIARVKTMMTKKVGNTDE